MKSECPDHEHSESTVHGSRFPLHTREAIAIDAAWLWPVDHPDVERETLDKLLAAIGHHDVARPRCEGRGGHPPLIKRALFAKLATCTNAREVMFSADVIAVEVLDKGTIEDIDR